MKYIFIFILLAGLVSGGVYYFADGRDLSMVGDYRSIPKTIFSTSTSGAVLGEAVEESVGAFNYLKNAVQDPARVIDDVTNNIKEGILDQVADILGVATSSRENVDRGRSGAGNGGNGDIGEKPESVLIAGTGNSADGLEICSAHEKNEAINYLVQFSSSTAPAAYSVNWGDGTAIQQHHVTSSPDGILISHAYAGDGNYMVEFMLLGSGEVLARKEICVR